MKVNTKCSKAAKQHIKQHKVKPFESLVPSIELSFTTIDVTEPLLLDDLSKMSSNTFELCQGEHQVSWVVNHLQI